MTQMRWPREWADLNRDPNSAITVFGKLVIDHLQKLDKELVVGGHNRAERDTKPGGAPANVTAELNRHGFRARFAGWVGEDPEARTEMNKIRARGIEIAVKREGVSPSATVIVQPNGEKTLFTNNSIGGLRPIDVKKTWFAGSAAVHLDGYDLFFERFPEAVMKAANLAHESNALVSFDMGAANRILDPLTMGVRKYLDLMAYMRPHVVFANESEAEALQLLEPHTLDRLEAEFAWRPLLVVHQGSKPTVVSYGDNQFEREVQPASMVDTTGCGDAFAAGFLSGWVTGLPISRSVDRGHAWALQVGQVLGAQVPIEDVVARDLSLC